MKNDYDLSTIDPRIREHIIVRIYAIEEFVANPGRKAAERIASKIGIKVSQFYSMVKVWKNCSDPTMLARSGRPKNRRCSLNDPPINFIKKIINQNDRTQPDKLVNILISAGEECKMNLPPRANILRHIFKIRSGRLALDVGTNADLIIDHTVIDLSVAFADNHLERPLATFIIDARRDTVLGISLSQGRPSSTASLDALRDAMERSPQAFATAERSPIRISLPVYPNSAADELNAALLPGGYQVWQVATGRWAPC